jgi:hypothetical protein
MQRSVSFVDALEALTVVLAVATFRCRAFSRA